MAPSPTRSRGAVLPGRGIAPGEIELGRIVGVFGVRGEVRLHLHNRESSVLLDGAWDVVLVHPDGRRTADRLSCRPGAGKRILGRLDGVTQREQAAALKGTQVVLARDALPEPDEGEFYVTDLQGLRVMADGEDLGRVTDVHHTDGGDLLELALGGEPAFVPFAGPHILEIDLDGGRLVLDPALLLDDED